MRSLKPLVFLILLGLISGGKGAAQQPWKLTWSDEFNGKAGAPVDPGKWTAETGGSGWGNQEREYYTNSPKNAFHDGQGSLVIKVLKDGSDLHCWYGDCQYTSARLVTRGKLEQKYGRFEARLKIPFGQGIWPAFWMLGADIGSVGWPGSGELDIMENIGREPNTVHGTIHGPGYSGGSGIGTQLSLKTGKRFADDFHLYAVEWEPEAIRWYVDDTLYQTRTPKDVPAGKRWVFDHPFFVLLNVAVGGGWPGYPDETSSFPQTMTADYLRVYSR